MSQEMETALTAIIREGASFLTEYAFSVLGAILILILGFILASVISRGVRRFFERVHATDQTLAVFLSNAVKYIIWALVIVTVLAQFGVKTTSIIAALGAAGLAIGLALQGTLANIAAGIMLLVLRPFRVGEYIEASGISGTVNEIGLFTTTLKRVDGLFVMSPNSELWNTPITNYSRNPTRRFELLVGIGYEDNIAEARRLLLEMVDNDERVLKNPAPVVFVNSLDDSSVGVGLRVWTHTNHYLQLSWDLTEEAKSRFESHGLTIPFPQRDVRVITQG